MKDKKIMAVPFGCFLGVIAVCLVGIIIGSFCDFSINEALLLYTREQQSASGGRASAAFTPSVCNRLDRNTSGLICFAN